MSTPSSPAEPGASRGGVNQWFVRFVAWSCTDRRRSAQVLLAAIALAALSLSYGAGIRIDIDLKALLPATAPSVAALDQLKARKGNTELLSLAVIEMDAAARQQMIDALAEEVGTWPETETVHLGREFTSLRDHALYFLETDQLEELRDTLVKERRKAVAGVLGPGISDEPAADPSQFLVGDDWDSFGDEDGDDEDGDDGEGDDPAPPADPEAGADFPPEQDLDEWLAKQKDSLAEKGTLSRREIEAIWLEENEAGELVWEERVIDPFVNTAGDVQLLKATLSLPPTDLEFARSLATRTSEAVARIQAEGIAPDAQVQIVSSYNVSREVNTILEDAQRATLLSALLVILVLVVGFRRVRALWIVMVPMLAATCFTLAVARLAFSELNALTVFLFAVLFGMGVDFSVHLYALRQRQGAKVDWPKLIEEHLRPLASTMLTTAGSLLVLGAAEFKAFREFGLISGAGVAICFLCAVILVPVVDTLLGPGRSPRATSGPQRAQIVDEPRGWRISRFVILAGFAAFAVVGAPKVEFEKDVRQLKVKRSKRGKINYGSASGRCSKSLVLLAESPEALDAAVETLERERDAQALLPNGSPLPGKEARPWIRGVYSVKNAMPVDQSAKQAVNREIAEQANAFLIELPNRKKDARKYQSHLESLERLAKADPLTQKELPGWAIEPFREKDGGYDRLGHVCLRINNSHLDELAAVKARLDELVGVHGVLAADSRLVFADLIGDIERDSHRLPILALGVIFFFIAADLRKLVDVLACFGALALGLGLAVGVMGLWPIRLNFFNIVVMPAVVGLGIDASIHLWHGRRRASLSASARATLLAAMTTVAGFAGLLVARHPGLHSIGVLGVTAVSACIIAAFATLYPLRRRDQPNEDRTED